MDSTSASKPCALPRSHLANTRLVGGRAVQLTNPMWAHPTKSDLLFDLHFAVQTVGFWAKGKPEGRTTGSLSLDACD